MHAAWCLRVEPYISILDTGTQLYSATITCLFSSDKFSLLSEYSLHNCQVNIREARPVTSAFARKPIGMSDRIKVTYVRESESAFLRISPIDDTSPWPDTSLMRLQLATMHILTFHKGLHSNCTLEEVSVSSHPPLPEQSVPVPLLHIQPFPSRSQGCCYCSSPLQPLLLHVWLRGDLPREDYVPVGGGEHQGSHCQPAAQHGPRTLTGEGCWA